MKPSLCLRRRPARRNERCIVRMASFVAAMKSYDFSDVGLVYPDVEGHWAAQSIRYCVNAKLFSGVSTVSFAPETNMCIDLFSGETCFYKYGAAPSFVKNGKTIRRVRGESLAAGVCAGEGSAPDIVRMAASS